MGDREVTSLKVACPCCGSTLDVDPRTGTVGAWAGQKDPRKEADLKDAEKLLREEKARVEARYREIVRSDKEKGAAMDRKFQEFLEKSQGEPVTRPVRDVDLD